MHMHPCMYVLYVPVQVLEDVSLLVLQSQFEGKGRVVVLQDSSTGQRHTQQDNEGQKVHNYSMLFMCQSA